MTDVDLIGLRGRTAVVFGGGQGIGEAASIIFAEAGAEVAIVDIDRDRANRVAESITARGGQAQGFAADLLDPAAVETVLGDIVQALGSLHALVNIIGRAEMKAATAVTPDDWDRQMSINVRQFFFAATAFARRLIDQGQGGSIVAVASVDGLQGAPHHAPYGAAKAAMMHLVKSFAVEWADDGIRVNCLSAGSTVTPRVPETDATRAVMRDSMIPMRRSAQPREIAGPLLFLCSDLAAYVTGQALGVDGGWMAANFFNMGRDASGGRFSSILANEAKA